MEAHASIASACLAPLEGFLKHDVLDQMVEKKVIPRNSDIPELSSLLEQRMNPTQRYASSYWPYHAAEALEKKERFDEFGRFIETKLLNWVELMSLRGQLLVCVKGLSQLRQAYIQWAEKASNSSDVSLKLPKCIRIPIDIIC
jgi:hypothetical protein